MNLLLLYPDELSSDGTVRLGGRRALHAREVLRAITGDVLRVGVLGGSVGTAQVLHVGEGALELQATLMDPPPPRAGVDLLLAIPRPKALKKVLPAIASLGVDRVVLVNAARVEKSYFDSKVLAPDFIAGLFAQGLEQARDTVPPQLAVRERFRPFIEDELDAHFAGAAQRWLAHPVAEHSARSLPSPGHGRVLLAVGPEGGWVPFELELLRARGFVPFSVGPRILRVEVAVPLLLGQVALRRADAA